MIAIYKRIFPILLFSPLLTAQTAELPENLGGGLRELVGLHRARPAGMIRLDLRGKTVALHPGNGKTVLADSAKQGIISDRTGRVLVTVVLDGSVPALAMGNTLRRLGASVTAEDPFQPTTLSALLPLDSAEELAKSPGVIAVKLSRQPMRNVGAVTSQGVQIIQSDQVNGNGITGQGITIGILSDSFDNVSTGPHAADDVSTNDLPNMGVPDGRPGLKFLSDGAGEALGDTDEGRALAQVAYDVAPGISLCFASVDSGPVGFAKNIRRLRTDSSCFADIAADDIQFIDEPMFADGPIAQAIDDIATSSSLAGKKVAYFAAAGNNSPGGYASDLRFIADADARGMTNSGLTLTGIPARIDTTGGFHNFNPDGSGTPALYQSITLADSTDTTIVMQWDDPFDLNPSGITTDLNLLIFDTRGRYLGNFADNNFSTDEPIEIADLPAGSYRLVIARTGRGSHLSTRVRYVAFNGTLTGDYINARQPTLFGHAASRNALAVGAYVYDNGITPSAFTPQLEAYSSAGPVTIVFDTAGNRLATPEIRNKPDISAPDCVETTFFFNSDTNDAFFTFCGTSAATPHAAGAAALLLQAAGGPGSLSNDQIRAKLQGSSAPRDIDQYFSQANLASGAATVNVTATGDTSNASAFDPNFFHIAFQTSTTGQTLTGITIDLGPAGLNFDPSAQSGLPLTPGSASTGVTITSPSPGARSSVLTLTFSGFATGTFLNFGIDRDLAATNSGGNSADLLAGAKVTATFSSGTSATGVFVNNIGTGYSPLDGYGLINVPAALKVN